VKAEKAKVQAPEIESVWRHSFASAIYVTTTARS